jgi:hypothetical protein
MPAHVPPSPPRLSPGPRERKEALQRSKTLLVQHAIVSAALALFFIGFNAAFTRGLVWFPWPLAALIVLWLYHLLRHLERVRRASPGINAWLDLNKLDAADYRHLSGGRDVQSMDPGSNTAHEQTLFNFGQPAQRRKREWLE